MYTHDLSLISLTLPPSKLDHSTTLFYEISLSSADQLFKAYNFAQKIFEVPLWLSEKSVRVLTKSLRFASLFGPLLIQNCYIFFFDVIVRQKKSDLIIFKSLSSRHAITGNPPIHAWQTQKLTQVKASKRQNVLRGAYEVLKKRTEADHSAKCFKARLQICIQGKIQQWH